MRRVKFRWVVTLAAILLGLIGLAYRPLRAQGRAKVAGEVQPKVRDLQVTERNEFPFPAPAIWPRGNRCDLNGNLYASYSESLEPIMSTAPYSDGIDRIPFYKLSVGDKKRTAFPVPSISGYPYLLRREFDVDTHGTVYALFDAYDKQTTDPKERNSLGSLIVRYKDDGEMDSYTKLADFSDKYVVPMHFAVFPDGSLLVTGTLWGSGEVGPFTAVFNRYGNFVASVKLPHDLESAEIKRSARLPPQKSSGSTPSTKPQEPAKQLKQPPVGKGSPPYVMNAVSQSLTISAPDGNVYMVRPTDPVHLYAVSPAGEVVHDYELWRPGSGMTPFQMALAGTDKLFIQFRVARAGRLSGQPTPLIAVFELSTGDLSTVYQVDPAEKEFSEPGCASSPYDFVFLGGSKDNKLEAVRFNARLRVLEHELKERAFL